MRSMLVAVMTLAPACASGGAAAPTAQPAKPTAPMGWTGILQEQAFKDLHVLRQGAAPAARGQTVDLADGSSAYLSLPEGPGPHPGVIVIHEWWGLNDHIRHWADRLAADGYAAVAVDLYAGQVATDRDTAYRYVKSVVEARAYETIAAAYELLVTDDRIRAPRVGSVGWCFGGGWSLNAAIAMPDLDAAVIYYGRLVTDEDVLRQIQAPILGVFGNLDPGIPPASVDAFEAAMKNAGKLLTVARYEANHAFANPSSGRYDATAAEDAFGEVRAFFSERLKR